MLVDEPERVAELMQDVPPEDGWGRIVRGEGQVHRRHPAAGGLADERVIDSVLPPDRGEVDGDVGGARGAEVEGQLAAGLLHGSAPLRGNLSDRLLKVVLA